MNNTYWKKLMRKTFMGITIFLLSFIGFLAQAGNAFAAADVTKPVLKGITVDKKEATVGETVKISVDAEDTESGIKFLVLTYMKPITKNEYEVKLYYNQETKKYEGLLNVTDTFEPGTWKIKYLFIYDYAGNVLDAYNKEVSISGVDLTAGNFNITGTHPDVTAPTLNSIQLNKKEATSGDTIKISIDATDEESGIKFLVLTYMMPITKKEYEVKLYYNQETKKYEGLFDVTDTFELGEWKIKYLFIYDYAGNVLDAYNKEVSISGVDLTAGNFTVKEDPNPIQPLPQKVVKTSTTWTNQTVEGDLYIGPNSTLTVNGNVTVNGDIYVLGSILNYGNLTVNGTIHARQFLWGSYSTSNGNVSLLGGINHIPDMLASNRVLTDIPFSIYTQPLIAKDGKISFEGATLPIVNMAIEGQPIKLNYNGTFKVEDLDVGDKNSLTVTFTDVFFNTITKEIPVQILDTIAPTASTNVKGGYYSTGKQVALTMSEKGSIFYTLDGSEPTTASHVYEQPISINQNTVLKYIAIDKAGNKSNIYKEEYAFFSVNEITDQSKAVTGKAKPDSTITVRIGTQEWKTTAGKDGTFAVAIPAQTSGQTVAVFAKDTNGLQSDTVEMTVKDITAPAAPKVNAVTDQSTEVTGTTEANATVAITVNGKTIASATAGTNGTFTIKIPIQTAGTELLVTATDKASNVSKQTKVIVQDVTAPNKPTVQSVTDNATEVKGTTEADAKVTVMSNEKIIASGNADKDGNFKVTIPVQKAGTELIVTATDKVNNVSEPMKVIVQDGTAPNKPTVNTITDQTTKVTGNTEALAVVNILANGKVIGSTTADKDGNFTITIPVQKANIELSVTATDKAGNTSESTKIIVKDVTAPAKPTMNEITNFTKDITGKTEPAAKVTILANNNEIGSATADTSGNVTVHIPAQKVGTELTIIATDQAGNKSKSVKITVKQGYTGWTKINNNWYYYKPETGTPQTDWGFINNQWYFFNKEGIMQTNWQQINGTWYFFNSSGAMQTNWQQINGNWYFFNSSGAMQTNWQQINGTWYLFKASGIMHTGWTVSNGTWYFLNQSGAMQTGWAQIGGVWYLFNTSGTMQTGWAQIGGVWYFLNQYGAMQTGWQQINGTWYYFYNDGRMAANTTIGGYKLGANGALI
ncbi:Ig-like domain-containing protein [Bacillus rhizoplanae]|uniref:Ig-like domain-containing protein n=1 Tax=Bacillus rhizoplanae TaxID=2880966 RepID=UPI003D23709B